MQRDGALFKIRPCGSTHRLGVSHASMFWMLLELVARNDTFSFVFVIVVRVYLLQFIYYFSVSSYNVEADVISKGIIKLEFYKYQLVFFFIFLL